MTAPGHSSEKAIAVIPIDANPYLAYLNTAWRHSQRALPNSLDAFPKHTTTYGQPERGRARGRHPKPIVLQINLKRRASTILTIQEIKLDARASDRTSRELGLEVKVLAYVTLAPPDMEESPHDDVDGEWKAGHAAPTLLHTLKNLKLYSPSLTLLLKTVEECAGKGAEHWAHFAPGGKPARWSNEGLYMGLGLAQFWYPTVTKSMDRKMWLPPGSVEWLYSREHQQWIYALNP
ncbi:hypothetical protein BDW71DRAFT_197881 [Aspergillus fruticulosus]